MVNIVYAGYGLLNSTFDVTESINAAYRNGQRYFQANNSWGGDPFPGNTKYLYIIWNVGGSLLNSGVAIEDQYDGVVLPGPETGFYGDKK